MRLVVDASALAALVLPDETTPAEVTAAIAEASGLQAPWLLWPELRNILLVCERRGRLTAGTAERLLEAVDALGITLTTEADSDAVLCFARAHGLSAYDALYLASARRAGAGLLTLDGALGRAAAAEGVATP